MKKISLIGAGAVGRSIALALFKKGILLTGIYSQGGTSAATLAKKVKASFGGPLEDFKGKSDLILIAVKDSEIRSVAEQLSKSSSSLKGTTAVHLSGALAADELQLLKKKGAAIGSFHPMQTFPAKNISGDEFNGVWIALEGDRRAVAEGKVLAKKLLAHHFTVSGKEKTVYHLAGVFASNYLVTLLSVVEQLAVAARLPRKDIWNIFLPIIRRTISNVVTTSPKASITGVIVRKDVKMIRKHLATLSRRDLRHLVQLYAALGIETSRMAAKKNAR